MTSKTAEPASPATKFLHAAERATAAAEAALGQARAELEASQKALRDAEAEAQAAITVKSADAPGARARLETARAAIKQAEDDVTWAVLRLNAFDVEYEDALHAEQAARRRLVAEEYVRESEAWHDPENRERALLQQLTDIVAELCPMISARKSLWAQLIQQLEYLPADEKPDLPPGHGLMRYDWQRADLPAQVPHPELFDAINAGVGGR